MRGFLRYVILAIAMARCSADLDVASDLSEEIAVGDGLHVVSTEAAQDEFQTPEGTQTRARPRLKCDLSIAKTGDVEMQYWCGWALQVSREAGPPQTLPNFSLTPSFSTAWMGYQSIRLSR